MVEWRSRLIILYKYIGCASQFGLYSEIGPFVVSNVTEGVFKIAVRVINYYHYLSPYHGITKLTYYLLINLSVLDYPFLNLLPQKLLIILMTLLLTLQNSYINFSLLIQSFSNLNCTSLVKVLQVTTFLLLVLRSWTTQNLLIWISRVSVSEMHGSHLLTR